MGLTHPAQGLFSGRYRLHTLVKAGPGIETWRAADETSGQQVTVKLKSISLLPVAERWRLQREAEILVDLRHPGVQPLQEARFTPTVFFVVMPFSEAPTLRNRLDRGPLDVRETIQLGQDILRGLDAAHRHGVLHRNLNAVNVLVGEPAQLTDFSPLGAGEAGGLPTHLAPEQAGLLHGEPDARSDLYSLGALLYESLSGRAPFGGMTTTEVLQAQLTQDVPSLRTAVPQVPRALDQMISRLLARDPRARYQSAQGALWDLESLQQGLEAGVADPEVPIGLFDRRHNLAEPVFVGRRDDLATLAQRLERLSQGMGGVISVEARTGFGKSRLLQELGLLALQRGMLVLRQNVRQRSATHPFEVFAGLIEEVLQRMTAEEIQERLMRLTVHQRGVLVSVLPPLRSRLDGEHLLHSTVSESQVLNTLAALLSTFGREQRPVLLLIDGAEWTDPMTRRALQHFHQTATYGSHVLVVAASCVDDASGVFTRVERLPLRPFTTDEIRHLSESMTGPLPEAAHELINLATDGSPLIAVETLRAMVAGGVLHHDGSNWQFVAELATELPTTPRVAAAFNRRLERLSGPSRELLRMAAVLGRECDTELLAAVSQSDPSVLLSAVEEARAALVLWRTHDGSRLTFAHDRLRQPLLAEVPAEAATAWHRAAAAWLRANHPDKVFDLAYHLQQAAAPEEAWPSVLAAAAEARRRHAPEVAARYYEMAVPALAVATADVQLRMALDYADVLTRLGRFATADDWLQRAHTLSDSPVASARLHKLRSRLALDRLDPVAAVKHAEEGLAVLRDVPGEPGATALLYRLLADAWRRCGRMEPALKAVTRGQEMAREHGLDGPLLSLDTMQALILACAGQPEAARRLAEDALRRAGDVENPLRRAQTEMALVPVFLTVGEFQQALRCAEAAHRALPRLAEPRETNRGALALADAMQSVGRLREAAGLARQTFRQAQDLGDVQTQAAALSIWIRGNGGLVPEDVLSPWLAADAAWPTDRETLACLVQAVVVWHLRHGAPEAAAALLAQQTEGNFAPSVLCDLLRWMTTAWRRVAESASPMAVRDRHLWLERASGAMHLALEISHGLPQMRPRVLREAALLAAMRGHEERTRDLFGEALAAAANQPYDWAVTRLARHRVGLALGWPEAAADAVEANRELSRMQVTAIPELGIDLRPSESPVTIALADRFSNVVESGRRLVGADSVPALLDAVNTAAQMVLRAERICVWDARAARFLAEYAPPLAVELRERVLIARQAVALNVEEDGTVPEVLLLEEERCGVGAPIVAGREVRYVLIAMHSQAGGFFVTEELRLADYLRTLGSAALENLENLSARVESETRFRLLYERADVGIALLSLEGQVLEGNPYLLRATGYSEEDLIGQRFDQLIGPMHREQAWLQLQRLLEGQADHCRLEMAVRRRTGELLWMTLAAALVRATDRTPRFVIAALSDMSHRGLERVVGFQETERRVLASELHDTIVQPLVGLYYGLQNTETAVEERDLESTLTQVRGMEDQTQRLLDDMRALISNISTLTPDNFDALEAVPQYVNEFRADTGLEVWLRIPSGPRLAGVAGLFLYRIVQEALRNVARHAAATRLRVSISFRPGVVRGSVADNGRGLPSTPVEGRHFGLRGMRERAELLGGQCRIRSVAGRGTTVVFEIPLPVVKEDDPGDA